MRGFILTGGQKKEFGRGREPGRQREQGELS